MRIAITRDVSSSIGRCELTHLAREPIDVNPGLPRQVDYRPDTVTIIEQWESVDALNDHLAAPHMADYRAKVEDLVAGVTLQVLETA